MSTYIESLLPPVTKYYRWKIEAVPTEETVFITSERINTKEMLKIYIQKQQPIFLNKIYTKIPFMKNIKTFRYKTLASTKYIYVGENFDDFIIEAQNLKKLISQKEIDSIKKKLPKDEHPMKLHEGFYY